VAALLKRTPGLQVQKLASDMGISARHLSRSFKATFGIGVKQFARLARIENIVAGRSKGLPWVEVACDCGMVDQAHLIKEFKEIVGQSPTRFFEQAICIEPGIIRTANFIVQGSETWNNDLTPRLSGPGTAAGLSRSVEGRVRKRQSKQDSGCHVCAVHFVWRTQ
jgi:AraC-like DNA-binding protein